MNVIFTAKNIKLSGAIKGFIREKLLPLEKIEGPIIDVEVIINKEKINYVAELLIKTKLNYYQSKQSHKILKQALRESLKNIRRQIKKNKAMIKDKKRILSRSRQREQTTPAEGYVDPATRASQPPVPVEMVSNYLSKPVTIAEAVEHLKKSGENALLFKNRENKKTSVVFYNRKKSVCLIEEEG